MGEGAGNRKPTAWIATLLVSAAAAAGIWALSPLITGHQEPWDAAGHYYLWSLLLAGAFTGLVTHQVRWAYFAGAVAGQLLYMLIFLKAGPLILVGVLTLCLYSVAFYLSALAAGCLRLRR